MVDMNGKTGEMLRWLIGALVAALVAYYTAAISTENRLTAVEVGQRLQFEEVQRALARIELDVRDVKRLMQ